MAKLYIFGIGGTGSRVLKALTMLMASGCKLENGFDTVVPMIIDPDSSNGNLDQAKNLLTNYQNLRNKINNPDSFFTQKVKTINELANSDSNVNSDFFQFQLENVQAKKFRDYIDFDSLPEDYKNAQDDKNFLRLLYSEQNLKSDLKVGFKGNPNMGAVVLNQFTNSNDFARFAETFQQGDAIFIINSIFGGTGAAGFPLLLKTLKGGNTVANRNLISQSKIGGITYLPYFSLDKQDEVNADSFDEKTKSALDYYKRTIIDENQINSLYFIGNNNKTIYKYAVGEAEQKNYANFIELAGALSVFDFCKNINSFTDRTLVKEFGIEEDKDNISFKNLNKNDIDLIKTNLIKYKIFVDYIDNGLSKSLDVSRWTKSNIKLSGKKAKSTLNKEFFKKSIDEVYKNNEFFNNWLFELSRDDNKPTFEVKYNENRVFRHIDIYNSEFIEEIQTASNNNKSLTYFIKLFNKSIDETIQKLKID